MQILIVVAKGCKPNSPIEDRAWVNMKPPLDLSIPKLSPALAALTRAGLLIRRSKGNIWRVKPSAMGYALVEDWKKERLVMRARPILFDRVIKDAIVVLDQRFDRYAGYNHNSHQAA